MLINVKNCRNCRQFHDFFLFSKSTRCSHACQEGHHRVVSALIFHGADCNIRTKDGQRTPIQVALASGYPNIAKILYYHGKAQVNITTTKGRTVLHLCAMFADAYDLLEAILAVRKLDIDTQDKYGNTPLHYAVKCGSLEMVKLLVEAGADIKTRNQANMTPLHIAIYMWVLEKRKKIETVTLNDKMRFLNTNKKC